MFIIISILTILIRRFAAITENDIKKIIAYSTIRQIRFIIIIINIGNSELAFFHLITHAIFKSLIFITAGTIIFHSNGEQDIRIINNISKKLPLDCIVINFSLIALIGFPFYSGFYSKDLIIEFFLVSNINYILMLIIYLRIFSTSIYAIRLSFYICWNNKYKINLSKWISNPEEKKILFIFIIPVLSSGRIIIWNFYRNFYIERSIHLIKKSIGVWAIILSIIISIKIIQRHNNYNKIKFFYVNIFYLENFIFFLINISTLLCNWYLIHWENIWIKFIRIKIILEIKQILSYKNLFRFYSLIKFTIFISLLIIIIY